MKNDAENGFQKLSCTVAALWQYALVVYLTYTSNRITTVSNYKNTRVTKLHTIRPMGNNNKKLEKDPLYPSIPHNLSLFQQNAIICKRAFKSRSATQFVDKFSNSVFTFQELWGWMVSNLSAALRFLPLQLSLFLLEFKLKVSNVGSPVCDNNVWVIKEWITIIFTWV